jgi:hypothetical protein
MDQLLLAEVFWLVPGHFQYCQRPEGEPSRIGVAAPATLAFNSNEVERVDLPGPVAGSMTPATVRGK